MSEAMSEVTTPPAPKVSKSKPKPKPNSKQKGAEREPMPTKAVLNGKTLGQRVEMVLESWDTVTRLLRLLKGNEILEAIKAEKKRDGGPRMNVLFRLAQRYDMVTKNGRIQNLIK